MAMTMQYVCDMFTFFRALYFRCLGDFWGDGPRGVAFVFELY